MGIKIILTIIVTCVCFMIVGFLNANLVEHNVIKFKQGMNLDEFELYIDSDNNYLNTNTISNKNIKNNITSTIKYKRGESGGEITFPSNLSTEEKIKYIKQKDIEMKNEIITSAKKLGNTDVIEEIKSDIEEEIIVEKYIKNTDKYNKKQQKYNRIKNIIFLGSFKSS